MYFPSSDNFVSEVISKDSCKKIFTCSYLHVPLFALKAEYYFHSPSCCSLFSPLVMSNSLKPYELQHTRLPCPSQTPRVCLNSCPLSPWYHPAISSAVAAFSSCLRSFPAWGSFPVSQLFASGGQSIGTSASASVFPMNIQDWFPLGLTGLISLQPKGLSRVFLSTTVQKHQFFGAQLSLSNSHIQRRYS